MSLKKKDLEVLFLLKNNSKMMSEIFLEIGTSERNLRYIIENLNFYLKKILNKKIEKDKKKLSLPLNNKESDSFFDVLYKKYYTLDQEERVEYILLMFLFLKGINLSFIEKKLEITRATLKKDIDILNVNLEKYSLKLESIKNKFTIVGNEKKYRHLKALKLIELINEDSYEKKWIDKDMLLKDLKLSDNQKIKKYIEEIEIMFKVSFTKEFKELIYIFLVVSLERIKEGKVIDRKANYKFLIETPYYKIVVDKLKEVIPEKFEYELVHLTEYFISGGVKENIKELKENIEKFVDGLIKEIKNNILEEIDYKELKGNLISYLVPAIYRLRNNFSLGSVGEKEKIYNLVEQYCLKENNLPEKLSEKEIYYISQEIINRIEKEKNKIISLKDLLVIIEKNSNGVNKEGLVRDLLNQYEELLKNDL
ncbi:MAG: helix-turn-helix domain-containing protein [Cetobacterium sp.]